MKFTGDSSALQGGSLAIFCLDAEQGTLEWLERELQSGAGFQGQTVCRLEGQICGRGAAYLCWWILPPPSLVT